MAKKSKKNDDEKNQLWYGITEEDFLSEEDNIVDEETAPFDKQEMTYFSQNVNLMRHLPRLADSLKPVERRILYVLFTQKSWPDSKPKKSGVVTGDTMTYHPHGDASIYGTAVGMAQSFTNPVPLLQGDGNFGNEERPKGYAAMRYTGLTLSKYAQDCFFSDYDDDCIEKIFSTAKDGYEPLVLPCKYPNLLVNGGFGLSYGNSFFIPSYNIQDIVKITKGLLKNPDSKDIYMMPDIPTGCDVIDNGELRQICDTGSGTLKMRSTITVEENPKRLNVWIIRVHNLPWMVSINSITDKLAELMKDNILAIKDVEDHSYPITIKNANGVKTSKKVIQFDIIISRSYDPHQFITKLYKTTQLEKSLPVNFKVVADALSVDKLDMRGLLLAWINGRKEYKRRLINKTISKLSAKISLLEILCVLTTGDNYLKTLKIIRNNTEANAAKALRENKQIAINSYQAEQVIKQGLTIFSSDAHDRYEVELKKKKTELKLQLAKAKDSSLINEEISEELDQLLKYDTGRRSRIVSDEKAIEIPDTDHFITITKLGMVKKLLYRPDIMQKKKTPSLGAFKTHDYPIHGFVLNNHDSLMLFDNFGRYSCVPVYEIENCDPSQYGISIYDIAKLNGEIVEASQFFSNDLQGFVKDTIDGDVFVVTLTKNGYLKKTPIQEFTKTRNQKNVKAMKIRDDDELVTGMFVIEVKKKGSNMLIYTEKGNFAYIQSDQIANQSKDSSGLLSITLDPDDACKGIAIIGDMDTHLLVVTEKGCMKRCELDYLGKPGKRKVSSYLATLDTGDKIRFVDTIGENSDITVCTRTTYDIFHAEDIPIKTRKQKCVKMVGIPLGNNIISVGVTTRLEK